MTDDEKKQYELARLGIARLMGDASEVLKWGEKVSQTRAAELQRAAVRSEQKATCAFDEEHDHMRNDLGLGSCPECGVAF